MRRSYRLFPRLVVCSAARQSTTVDIDSLACRVFCPVRFVVAFSRGKPSAYLRSSASQPEPTRAWHAHMMAVKIILEGRISFFFFSPAAEEAGLYVPWGVDETVQYNGQKFQRISQKPHSLYFRVKVLTPPYFLPSLTNVFPSGTMCVPFSPDSIGEDPSVSHFTRRLPGYAQGLWR